MGMHVRRAIREAIAAKLAGITDFGGRVYTYRTAVHITLPAAVVFTPKDEVDPDQTVWGPDGLIHMHNLTVIISAVVKASNGVDDLLDGLCAAVEKLMWADDTFGGMVSGLEFIETQIAVGGELEKDHGIARLEYQCQYRTAAENPEAAVL